MMRANINFLLNFPDFQQNSKFPWQILKFPDFSLTSGNPGRGKKFLKCSLVLRKYT